MALDSKHEPRRRRPYFGWAGLCVGIVALGLALLPGWIAPNYDPPERPIPQRAADWLGELKDKAAAAFRMTPAPPPPIEQKNSWRDPRLIASSLVLAFLALMLAVLSFVRHEDQRVVACSVALGAGAIAAQYFITALLILAFSVLVGNVLTRHP